MYLLFHPDGVILVKNHAIMLNGLVADGSADQVPELFIGIGVVYGIFVAVNLIVRVVFEREQVAQLGKAEVHFQQLGQCHVDLFVDHGNGFIGRLKNHAVLLYRHKLSTRLIKG